jgi:alpha-tubulin suppressor-like RCC1 family protein
MISSETSWVSCARDGSNVFALKLDGTIWGWGDNSTGQLSTSSQNSFLSPIKLNDEVWVTASAGGKLLLHADGTLWSSGSYDSGIKYPGSKFSFGNDWRRISAREHTLAIQKNGTLWSWGSNSYKALGLGNTSLASYSTPQQIGISSNWLKVAAGSNYSGAIKTDGSLWMWGAGINGNLGEGTGCNPGCEWSAISTPTQVGQGYTWSSLTMSGRDHGSHTYVVRSDNTIWSFGYNDSMLGGTKSSTFTPYRIDNSFDWLSVETAGNRTLALKKNFSLWAWGTNTCGEVGDGTQTAVAIPKQIGSDTNWTSISASEKHSLAIKSDGSLWSWGCNDNGELGNGSLVAQTAPAQIGTDSDWVEVSAGASFSIGRKSNGTIWVWGKNDGSFAIDGTGVAPPNSNLLSPIQVQTENNWNMVFASKSQPFAFARKANGEMFSWGNHSGGYHLGRTSSSLSPATIASNTNWKTLSSFGLDPHTIAIKADGTIWGWGRGDYFILGPSITYPGQPTPTQIQSGTDWSKVTVGKYHVLAIKNNKSLWSWGSNGNFGGSLGNNSKQNSASPQLISDSGDWNTLSSGSWASFAIKDDGSLWGWGLRSMLGLPNTQMRDWFQHPAKYE